MVSVLALGENAHLALATMLTSSTIGSQKDWPRIAVVGAGAVGGYFGGLMARAGAPVIMIGRTSFVDAVRANGLFLDTLNFKETVQVEASTELGAARGADLVLFCVKTTDSVTTARSLATFLTPRTTVVSLQNGVDNITQLRSEIGLVVYPAVVYLAATVPAPGHVKHSGRGDLVIGREGEEKLASLFARAGVPCRITDRMDSELWTKFMVNCAMNAISALGQVTYGRIAEQAGARALVGTVVDEVIAIARASHLTFIGTTDAEAAKAQVLQVATQIGGAFSSTAQDLSRGKLTEIDSLNGFIVRRGRELGIPTPANLALFTLVKLVEERALSKS